MAIAHAHYPLRDLIDLAKGALKNAKRERYLRGRSAGGSPEGMLNYVLVGGTSPTDHDSDGGGELAPANVAGGKVLRQTLRPYTAAELRAMLKLTGAVKSQLHGTKLEALRTTAFLRQEAAVLEGLGAMLRVQEKRRDRVYKELRQLKGWELVDFPWLSRSGELANPWADIADLSNYVSTGPAEEEHD
jgi:hypothetical protein